jgi:ADP-ribose pyrophosphatase YjhB (NUDIX family)
MTVKQIGSDRQLDSTVTRGLGVVDAGDVHFIYRVAGVCIHGGHALIHRGEHDNSWSLPGGRVELGEIARGALVREMREEIGQDVWVGRLIWVVEHLFGFGGRRYHELALYFEMALPDGSPVLDPQREFIGESGAGFKLVYRWFPLDEIAIVRLYPAFLRTALPDPPDCPEHVVEIDAGD